VNAEHTCDRMLQRIIRRSASPFGPPCRAFGDEVAGEGRLRPKSVRRVGPARLTRRRRANTGKCEQPGQTKNMCSPALFEVECRTPEQMRMANAFCRYLEMATKL
jgi:hypothetical protein